MRKLSREYGWSAVGVYLLLTAIDFPFCFIAVRAIGTERIGEWEHYIVEWFKRAVPIQIPEKWRSTGGENVEEAQAVVDGAIAGYDHGVKDAEKANTGDTASMSLEDFGSIAPRLSIIRPKPPDEHQSRVAHMRFPVVTPYHS